MSRKTVIKRSYFGALVQRYGDGVFLALLMLSHVMSAQAAMHDPVPSSTSFAFVLFYSASCPHCQRFAPVLSRYAKTHHIPVLAYTLDGGTLTQFANAAIPTRNELARFFPSTPPVVPTVFVMNIRQRIIYPLFQGEATLRQLNERMIGLQQLMAMRATS